jgi:predicted ATP-grasp superfamily ATP-dependent carboligase
MLLPVSLRTPSAGRKGAERVRVFLYEYSCAPPAGADMPACIRREGRAMLDALAADVRQVPGVRVVLLPEPVLDRWRFAALAARADWTVVIAPEFDGILYRLCTAVVRVGGRLLGPSPAAVALAGDKWRTYRALRRAGVPTPRTWKGAGGAARFPLVQKPRDGAGSIDTRLIRTAADVKPQPGMLFQKFVPGTAASVAVLCGPGRRLPLVPTWQDIADDGTFAYRGGTVPLPPELGERAKRLALRAVGVLPYPRGYIGVDLVLGAEPDGRGDRVIEINPRLTTSYIGLRALAEDNLAGVMVRVGRGRRVPEPRWRGGRVTFTPEGVTIDG